MEEKTTKTINSKGESAMELIVDAKATTFKCPVCGKVFDTKKINSEKGYILAYINGNESRAAMCPECCRTMNNLDEVREAFKEALPPDTVFETEKHVYKCIFTGYWSDPEWGLFIGEGTDMYVCSSVFRMFREMLFEFKKRGLYL